MNCQMELFKWLKFILLRKENLKLVIKWLVRHGNKGIVARIVREEDMPFLEDGTPVDIVLKSTWCTFKDELGQIYETVLAWAGQKLGLKFSTPIFDGASLDRITYYSDEAGIPRNGKTYLI